MNRSMAGALALCCAAVLSSCLPDDTRTSQADPTPPATGVETQALPEPTDVPAAQPLVAAPAPTRRPAKVSLLFAAAGGDGDSWKDRQGREYRMGLINTPEYDECYGSAATAKRKAMTAKGFRAKVYATDTYGRRVAVITTASGVNLNVYLARHGYADDRYLEQFRSENPGLAATLDVAFASAKREKAGLWGACRDGGSTVNALAGASTSCHPDYTTCIPVKGDGSGNGQENDLDCGDIGKPVTLRQAGVDPYRLDSDGDGVGCE